MAQKRVVNLTFPYKLDVAGAVHSGAKLTIKAPFAGWIKRVDEFLNEGPHGLVGIKVSHGGPSFLPRAEDAQYINITNSFCSFNTYEFVEGGEEIVVDMFNGDSANQHQATVIINIDSEP